MRMVYRLRKASRVTFVVQTMRRHMGLDDVDDSSTFFLAVAPVTVFSAVYLFYMSQNKRYPTLFLSTNTHGAVWYLVENRRLTKLDERHEQPAHYSDNEGFFQTSGPGGSMIRAGAPKKDKWLWQEETKHHLRKVAEHTADIWQHRTFQHLIISVPEHEKHQLERLIKHQLPHVPVLYQYGNYTNMQEKRLYLLADKLLH